MKKYFNLQLFDDGGLSGKEGTAGTGDGGRTNAGNSGSYSFEQAEEIANARAQRAEKAALASYFKQQGMSEDEVSRAITAYKAQQAANRPDIDGITRERDDALAELANLKNGNALRARGIRGEDVDYVMFKVNALMQADSKLDFEKAADRFLKENPRFTTGGAYKVRTGTDNSGQGGTAAGGNAAIHAAISRAARR